MDHRSSYGAWMKRAGSCIDAGTGINIGVGGQYKDDMITHLGILSNLENGRKLARLQFARDMRIIVYHCILSNLENGRKLARFSNSPGTRLGYACRRSRRSWHAQIRNGKRQPPEAPAAIHQGGR